MKWYSFKEVVADVTSKFNKIKTSDYKTEGKFKIIDQGKDAIAGYTDDESLINTELLPIVVFGDHTRVIKYEDTPIALGADGAKALKINSRLANTLYVYYYLRSVKLKEAGYSRHFKFLKEISIPIPQRNGEPNLDDQIRIAHLLSKVEGLISQRKQSLQLLDDLLKSIFLEMFGDPKSMQKKEKYVLDTFIRFLTSGSRGWAKYYSKEGSVFLRINNVKDGALKLDDLVYVNAPNTAEAKRTRVEPGDLLLSITADLGRTAVVTDDLGGAFINQHLALIRLNMDEINPVYLAWFFALPFGRAIVNKKNREGVKAGLNFDDIRGFEFIKPPIEVQRQFAIIVEKVESIKFKYQKSLSELENLYGALSQKAFKGELDLTRVPLQPGVEKIESEQRAKTVSPATPSDAELIALKLSAPTDLKTLTNTNDRIAVIRQWLNIYLAQLEHTRTFSLENFLAAMQQRLEELLPDEVPELDVAAYDQIKEWIFTALGDGDLEQVYDDDGNRVQIMAVKG